jgi:hypothetical protein
MNLHVLRICPTILVAATALSAADPLLGLTEPLIDGMIDHCGSCNVDIDTGWDVDHTGEHREGLAKRWAFSLRYESLDQDKLIESTRSVDLFPGSSARIRHRTVWLDIDHTISSNWSASLSIPWVRRSQDDIWQDETDPATRYEEHNASSGLGDIKAEVRWLTDVSEHQRAGLLLGAKLPTGSVDEKTTWTTITGGVIVDRTVEPITWTVNPGNGATDLIVGAIWRYDLLDGKLGFFARPQAAIAVDHRDEYRPGNRYSLNIGTRYQIAPVVGVSLQATGTKALYDVGSRSESDESGGQFITVSPGVSIYPTPDWQFFANYLWPAYNNVHGEQLVATSGYSLGTAVRF